MPTVAPAGVSISSVATCWTALAIPKSAIFTPPSPVISRFSGLTSRWTIRITSACESAASSPSSTPATWASDIRPT